MNQRVYVTTAEGATAESAPTFLVSSESSDEFVDEMVRSRYGTQGGGVPHEWHAFNLEEVEGD